MNEGRLSPTLVLPPFTGTVTLTFDDGPDDLYTLAVLEILGHYRIQGTFFCLGSNVEKNPNVLRQISASGHLIGNHTWSHPYITKTPWENVAQEIAQTTDAIERIIGSRPRLFRPPYGDIDAPSQSRIHDMGYQIMLWDIDSKDWSGISGPEIMRNVFAELRGDGILLLHTGDHAPGTIDVLPYIIETARALGYAFASVHS